MAQHDRPESSSGDPVEGRPAEPERKEPGYRQPEPDPFPGYGEPPPDAGRDSPPNVPRRDWGPPGNTDP
jgi:hypothetical protein